MLQAAGCCRVHMRAQGRVNQTRPERFVVLTRLRSAGIAEGTPVARSGIWRLKGIDISERAGEPAVWFIVGAASLVPQQLPGICLPPLPEITACAVVAVGTDQNQQLGQLLQCDGVCLQHRGIAGEIFPKTESCWQKVCPCHVGLQVRLLLIWASK